MKSSNIEYFSGADQLRGLGALLIIFYHGLHYFSHKAIFGGGLPTQHWLKADNIFDAVLIEGHTAVALFIVLSGFLLTIGSHGKKILYRSFLINRALRIFPMYLFLMIFGIYAYPGSFSLSAFIQSLIGFSNTSGAITSGSFTSMFWFAGVMIQLYLLFPFLNTLNKKKLVGIIAVFTVFRVLAHLENSSSMTTVYFSILGRMDQFIIGMLSAIYFLNVREKITKKKSLLFFAAGLVVFSFSLFFYNKLGGWPEDSFFKLFWTTYEATLWAIIIVSYIFLSNVIPTRVTFVLRFVGGISYSLFLVHFMVIMIFLNNNYYFVYGGSGPKLNAILNTIILVIPIAIFVATLTYNYIEKPFLKLRFIYKRS